MGPSVLCRSKKFEQYLLPSVSQHLLKTIAVMGSMYFLFVTGIKMDMKLVGTSSKKHSGIALVSILVPLFIVYGIGFSLFSSADANVSNVIPMVFTASITSFPSLFPVLKELNLLNSEVGRTSLTMAIISQGIAINLFLTFDIMKQKVEGRAQGKLSAWYVFTF